MVADNESLLIPIGNALGHNELFTDTEDGRKMYEQAENMKRGGIMQIPKRHAKAIKGLVDIVYWDFNNLYGTEMTQPLPVRGYKYWTQQQIHNEFGHTNCPAWTEDAHSDSWCWNVVPERDPHNDEYCLQQKSQSFALKHNYFLGQTVFWFKVDYYIPQHLHNYFSDYPLGAISRAVSEEEPSRKYKEQNTQLELTHDSKTPKLILDLHAKTEYLVHARNLLEFIKLGARVTKIHSIMEFRQENWLAEYVEFNNQKQREATSDSDKKYL